MSTVITPPTETGDTASGVAVRAREIARHYGEGETAVHALRGVDLDVQSEHLTAVMGPSGSGKSTLMHILAGLDQPSSGEVSVGGIVVGGLDDTALTQLRRDHIGFIFQFFNLLPMLTAAENIVLPLKLAGVKLNQEWFEELIDKVGLGDRLEHRPSELSGGQQQRVAVARALVSRPERDVRRRADRQPRLHHQRRDPRPPARLGRHARPDDRDGHARRARRGDRRPRAVPRRRRHRPRPRPRRRRTRSSRRSRR